MATTRLGLNGYGTRPAGSFAGKTAVTTHPVGVITRLGLNGYMAMRVGSFSGKTPAEIVPEIPVTPTPPPSGGRGSGPIYREWAPGYDQYREDALRETRRKRILAEDDDIVALIAAMITKRLM